ncbi:MAG: AAA family ATPase [Alphaproteobacteria bacterium]|nr:AAA family ATPase [Alphaproteobacteria bacterium]
MGAIFSDDSDGKKIVPTYQRVTFNFDKYKDNYEEAFWKIREGRVLLKMLMTLNVPSIVYKWLPNARFTSDGKYIHCSPYVLVIKQHINEFESTSQKIRERNRELISLMSRLKTTFDMMKEGYDSSPGIRQTFESECTQLAETLNYTAKAVSGHVQYVRDSRLELYKEERNVGDVLLDNNSISKALSLLDVYMSSNSITDRKKAVASLEEPLALDPDDIFSAPCLDKRRNWYHDLSFVINPQIHIIKDDYVVNTSVTANYLSRHIPILGTFNSIFPQISFFHIATDGFTFFPLTIWGKENSKKKYALPLLPAPPYPFLNDFIFSSDNKEIYLTETYRFAFAGRVYEQGIIPTFLVSWYGGQHTIKCMNWDAFAGKKVKYVLGINDPETVITAAMVYNVLTNKGISIEVFTICDLRRETNEYITPWIFCKPLSANEHTDDQRVSPFEREPFPIAPVDNFPELVRGVTGKDIESFTVDFSQVVPAPKAEEKVSSYTVITDSTITEHPKYLQAPIIAEKTISLIYSEPGIGKTWLALSCAYATSLGLGALKGWKGIGKKRKVLYIDSEMGETELKKRLQVMERLYGTPLRENPHFKCISLDLNEISLSNIDGQAEIDRFISSEMNAKSQDKPLIVIDNVLAVTEYSDHPKTWNVLFKWIRDMRDDGATILVIHHTNESGRQRGSGIKKAVVDNIFRVTKASDSDSSSIGLNIKIEKGRGIPTDVQKDFSLKFFPGTRNPRWVNTTYKISKEELTELVIGMTKEKKSVNEIMKATGFSKAKIQVVRRDAGLQRGYSRKQNGNGSDNQVSEASVSEAGSFDSDIM